MNYAVGDRIELVHMDDDPDPILPGATGTVWNISQIGERTCVDVDWDNGRSLSVILPFDRIRKVPA